MIYLGEDPRKPQQGSEKVKSGNGSHQEKEHRCISFLFLS